MNNAEMKTYTMTAEQIAEALWPHVPVTNWVRWRKAVQNALGAEEVVPRAVADELAETLEAYQSVVGYVPALAKYREAVERPDDDTYGQYNADGTPKRALRRTLEGMEKE